MPDFEDDDIDLDFLADQPVLHSAIKGAYHIFISAGAGFLLALIILIPNLLIFMVALSSSSTVANVILGAIELLAFAIGFIYTLFRLDTPKKQETSEPDKICTWCNATNPGYYTTCRKCRTPFIDEDTYVPVEGETRIVNLAQKPVGYRLLRFASVKFISAMSSMTIGVILLFVGLWGGPNLASTTDLMLWVAGAMGFLVGIAILVLRDT